MTDADVDGEALAELVRQYNLANAIMMRLTRVIDRGALTAIVSSMQLDLSTQEAAEQSAQAMIAVIKDRACR